MRLRLAVVIGLLVSCGGEEPLPPVYGSEPADISMVQLLADPGGYDGRVVRVVGFCRLEFEGNALYLHREDSDQMILKNGVWLALGWPIPENRRNLNDRYVLVEATFDAGNKGHLGLFSGELRDIQRMDAIESRAEVERLLKQGPKKP